MLSKIKNIFPQSFKRLPYIQIAFFICFVYWFFLAAVSETVVAYDSIGYENLGTLLKEKGWIEYFTTGPQREPAYPLILSWAMHIGQFFGTTYQTVLIFFQLGLLYLSQILTIKILKRIRISKILVAFVILYQGFSPALVGAAFRVYSEILTIPLSLLIILASHRAWGSLFQKQRQAALGALALALSFLLMLMVKGIFELITPLFLCAWVLYFLFNIKKERTYLANLGIFLLTFIVIFYGSVHLYKSLNKKYNGEYTLTDRGAWALYGNTSRRMEPLTWPRFKAALASVPGWGTCYQLVGPEACQFWSYTESDNRGSQKRHELEVQGLSKEALNRTLINFSISEAMKNPLQYALLALVESLKLFFWESLEVTLTIFPRPVLRVYNLNFLRSFIYFAAPLLTISSVLYGGFCLLKNKGRRSTDKTSSQTIIVRSILIFLICYLASHSMFLVDPRYSLPLSPLYIVLITLMLQKIFSIRLPNVFHND